MQLIEITRSFVWKISSSKYETIDFFCSRKEKCLKKDAKKTSKELHLFCKNEVINSVKDYKKELIKLETSIEKATKKLKQTKQTKIKKPKPKYFDNTKKNKPGLTEATAQKIIKNLKKKKGQNKI